MCFDNKFLRRDQSIRINISYRKIQSTPVIIDGRLRAEQFFMKKCGCVRAWSNREAGHWTEERTK